MRATIKIDKLYLKNNTYIRGVVPDTDNILMEGTDRVLINTEAYSNISKKRGVLKKSYTFYINKIFKDNSLPFFYLLI